jgi:hypothetical protein
LNNPQIKADSATMNAIVDAMGALAMVLTHRLPAEQRETMANDLARLARKAEEQGNTLLETLLIDLQRAVR